MRDEVRAELDEREYSKRALDAAELKALFADRDPRDFINPKSPAFKALGLKDKTLSATEALQLMARDNNLIKRPLTIVGGKIIAGFDRDELLRALR